MLRALGLMSHGQSKSLCTWRETASARTEPHVEYANFEESTSEKFQTIVLSKLEKHTPFPVLIIVNSSTLL